MNKIDHIAIGADSLVQGVTTLEEKLGITVPGGSKHDLMGTHNCVVQAGNKSFLEVIAINPDAPDPGRPRWFSMDNSDTRSRLRVRPRALCWVVSTTDLDGTLAASPVDLGEVVQFTRGDRSWRLTVPEDGHLPESGLLPAFIEWSPGPHPSAAQQDLGVRLKTVKLRHPDPASLLTKLKALNVDHLVSIVEGSVGLSFVLDCPKGEVTLD